MRLACGASQTRSGISGQSATYIFDVRAGMDSDDIAVLDSEVVANHSVDAGASIIKIVVGQHDQDCILALLAFYQYRVASEQL
jgi:hypothetical protein